MPPGTYLARELVVQPPNKAAVFVVPATIREFVTFALRAYPKAGFRLGRGDSEGAEAEDSFARGSAAGAFRIRQPYCDITKGELQITYVADLAAAKTFSTSSSTSSATTAP